jgi:hypothetical protein
MSQELATLSTPSQEIALPGGAEMIPFPSGRYAIPVEDLGKFTSLAVKEQERVKFLLGLFARMEAGDLVSVSESLGFQLRAVRGYSASNLRTLYYKWHEGGWQRLVRSWTSGSEGLPPEFVQHVRALMEKNARSMKQAMNAVQRDWFLGKAVPGYGTWQQWFLSMWPERDLPTVCPGTPRGWSKSNLYAVQPAKAQRMLRTRGFAAAKKFLPSIVRDPGSLQPLQLIAIDDFECDQLCFYWDPTTGARCITRMSGIVALDVATRKILSLILKPRLENDDGTKQAITRAEVQFLLYSIVRDHGIPAHGMTIMAENAAAAVTTELEVTFKNLFGGKVAITRTGVIDRAVLAHGFRETGGKPWLKGWVESFFNLMHNIAAGELPGQKGAHYMLTPGDHGEKLRLTERLIGQGKFDAQLSDGQLAQARVPFASPADLCDAYLQIFRWIEERTDHAMHGFSRVLEWRMHEAEPWRAAEELAHVPEAEQLRAQVRERMQSPRERWAALYPRIERQAVPAHALMLLLLRPKKAKFASSKLTFTHNGEGYTWLADPSGPVAQHVREGAEVLVYFDPSRPDHAHVARLDGRPLGEVRRHGKVDITDARAVSEAEKQLAAHYDAHLAEIRGRPLHLADDAQAAADRAVNADLVERAAELRNKQSVTATLGRTVDAQAPAITPAGEALAATIATAEQRERARKLSARALQGADLDPSDLL